MNKAIIGEEAFVTMIAGAAEVYDKETYGLLLGRRKKKDFLIDYAVPHQTTIRSKDSIETTVKHEKKLIDTINFLKGYRFIGEFHSHPGGPTIPSRCDRTDMRESGVGVSIIVSMEQAERYIPWGYDKKEKCLRGTVDDTFLVHIKAYRPDDKRGKRVYKLRIECPFIRKLNKSAERRFPALFEQLPKRRARRHGRH